MANQKKGFKRFPAASSCRIINFDNVRVVNGFIPETYILIVDGVKPYLNMEVRLVPMIYAKRPKYWMIEVVGCLPGMGLPALGPYSVSLPLDGILGTKGIEVVGANKKQRINVPVDRRVVLKNLKAMGIKRPKSKK